MGTAAAVGLLELFRLESSEFLEMFRLDTSEVSFFRRKRTVGKRSRFGLWKISHRFGWTWFGWICFQTRTASRINLLPD